MRSILQKEQTATKDFFYYAQANFQTKEELFANISTMLEKEAYVGSGFQQALLDRETDFPTGLPTSPAVAIPHTDGELVKKDALVFINNQSGIVFGEMGGEEDSVVYAKIIIMLVINSGQQHLEELQHLIQLIQQPEFLENVIASRDVREMQKVIQSNFK